MSPHRRARLGRAGAAPTRDELDRVVVYAALTRLGWAAASTVDELQFRTDLPRRRVTRALTALERRGSARWTADWLGHHAYRRVWRLIPPRDRRP